MSIDARKNFAKGTVSLGYDAAAVSIVLTTGHAARFPAVPFNATWWNSTDYPNPADDPNVEIVRVTAIVSDTLTVTRAQESTSASTKNTSAKTYLLLAGPTKKTIDDIETDLAAKAPLASPALTGTPTAPTAAADTNTTQVATTAFAKGEADAAQSAAATDATTKANAAQAAAIQRANHTGTQAQSTIVDLVTDLAAKAPLASPALTGTPTAPTAAADTNTTQVATTAFAKGEADAAQSAAATDATTKANAAQAAAIQRANHTGTQLAATISDFATAAQAIKLDDFAAPDDNTDRDATASAHGLMPKLDKVKLDGIDAKASAKKVIGIEIGDGTNVITTGTKGYFRFPWAATITKATILETSLTPVAGSIVLDVWKDTYANYPPTNADSITASAKPTLSTATKSEDSTLTGWTTSISAGDTLGVEVESVTSCTRVLLLLEVTLT